MDNEKSPAEKLREHYRDPKNRQTKPNFTKVKFRSQAEIIDKLMPYLKKKPNKK